VGRFAVRAYLTRSLRPARTSCVAGRGLGTHVGWYSRRLVLTSADQAGVLADLASRPPTARKVRRKMTTPSRDIARLIEIMAALRTPDSGCPWDLSQDFSTIAPYTIEEAYEVADAIQRGDFDDLRDELGDLLLQVVFHARMAEEAGRFAFCDVVAAITEKLVRRHPHVFGDAGRLNTEAVNALWDRIKAQEKAERATRRQNGATGATEKSTGALAGVPVTFPALTRALKLQDKAGKVGFDWNDPLAVLAKIREEADEIAAAIAAGNTTEAQGEVGDLLFAVVNLARHLGADPEGVLRATNQKFERRFAYIEAALAAAGKTPAQSTLEEMDELWNAAKRLDQRSDAGDQRSDAGRQMPGAKDDRAGNRDF
jgi:nucleoside triphosphate diphosphatase